MRKLWRAGSVWVFCASACFAQSGFLSSELQNKDAEGLRRLLATYGDSSPASELEHGMRLLALGALEWESAHPHAAHAAWNQVEALCRGWRGARYEAFQGKVRTRAAAVCALAGAERTAMESPAWVFPSSNRLAADNQAFLLGEMDENERLHVTGRLRAALSPAFGQDFKTSLVSWRVLERTDPSAPGTDYWLSLALQRQGNREGAAESFEKALALSPADPRALARKTVRGGEPDYGWALLFFSSPVRGAGLGARVFDERIADGGHAVALSARASTRGNLWADFLFSETQWTAPLQLHVSATGADRWRDFHGLGMASSDVPQSFRATEGAMEIELGWRQGAFGVTVGVAANAMTVATPPVGVSAAGWMGVWGQLEWDSTDRKLSPRTGWTARLRQQMAWTPAGNSFSTTTARIVGYQRLAVRHSVDWGLALTANAGAVPYNALADLFASEAPAVREFRFLDTNAASAWLRYRYPILPWLRVGAFGVAGAVAPGLDTLLSATRAGGGVEAEVLLQRTPKAVPRWEFGIFNGIWTFQGGIRAAL